MEAPTPSIDRNESRQAVYSVAQTQIQPRNNLLDHLFVGGGAVIASLVLTGRVDPYGVLGRLLTGAAVGFIAFGLVMFIVDNLVIRKIRKGLALVETNPGLQHCAIYYRGAIYLVDSTFRKSPLALANPQGVLRTGDSIAVPASCWEVKSADDDPLGAYGVARSQAPQHRFFCPNIRPNDVRCGHTQAVLVFRVLSVSADTVVVSHRCSL